MGHLAKYKGAYLEVERGLEGRAGAVERQVRPLAGWRAHGSQGGAAQIVFRAT